jgi:acetoacetate decarboxylase
MVPEPLEFDPNEPLVKYEFIRMPDSTGFGDYTETGQVIPVSFQGRKGAYTLHVPERRPADRGRSRNLGLSQKAR